MFYASKHPKTIEDFNFDFPALSIVSVRVSAPPELTVINMGATLPRVVLRISGGVKYGNYEIILFISLVSGGTKSVSLTLRNIPTTISASWPAGTSQHLFVDWSAQLRNGATVIGCYWGGDPELIVSDETYGSTWSQALISGQRTGAKITTMASLSTGETIAVDVSFL